MKYRYLKESTLFPDEVLKYEPFVIREAINNCIAHQDYTKGGRINVVEIEDEHLIFTNYGSFIPGSVENVITDDAPEEFYRNKFLATAMFNHKMVETAGGGIKKMFNYQRQRFFPMPEYDLSADKVKVTVTGKVLDMEFARVLARNPELKLEEIIALDKVQKQKEIPEDDIKHLKKLYLIEGRKPNFFISAHVASTTEDGDLKAQYIRNRGFDDEHYRKMIIEYLKTYKTASRQDFNRLLLDKLPEILTSKQKQTKIGNLLISLRADNLIMNLGSDKKPCWQIVSSTSKL